MALDWRSADVIVEHLGSLSWDNLDELATIVAEWITTEGKV